MRTNISIDLNVVPEKLKCDYWTKAFRKVLCQSIDQLPEFRRKEIMRKVIAAYNKDKYRRIDFDNIVETEIHTRSIIKLNNILKIVEYPPSGSKKGLKRKK